MALSTYSELKTAVADWLKRSDLATVIPDFITLAEVDMLHRLRLVEFETTGTVTMTAGTGTLPTGFLNLRSVAMDGDPQLRYLTPSRFDEYVNDNTSGDGVYYTITGSSIKTAPPTTGTLDIVYAAKFTALSDSSPTNSVLTNFPNAYLFGTLAQADIYIRKDPSTNMAKYNEAIQRILEQNHYRKYAGEMTVRPA